MIISPPILKTPQGSATDEQWLAGLMPFTSRGGFPIASRMAWHGGQHIEHTDTGVHGEPVRAIADGVVVYKRDPSPDADKKPLAYQGETDNGCVVIKHSTEIGEGPEGQIEYYSIYMHLKQVFVKKKQPVYRKDSLGSVGTCNGKNAIHLEIICDDANLKKIVGRSSGKLDISMDGRDKIVYGDMHFYLPPGTPFFASIASPQSPTGSGSAVHTSTVPLFVTMRFERGKCLLTTRQEESQQAGLFVEIGEPLANSDDKYEYNLYSKATALGDAFHIAPSAAYELLRFGRVINTGHEKPIPEGTVPHWHKVNYPGGQGWVSLNAAGVKKFSDADFPYWLGWTLIDDDPTPDSQCNSPAIEKWITGNTGKKLDKNALSTALADPKIHSRLSRAICKFPTEWEKSKIDTRYAWLKNKSDVLDEPMTEEKYAEFKAHAEALSFWEEAAIGVNSNHWHFHPNILIEQFRKCDWLGSKELAQCFPRVYYIYDTKNKTKTKSTLPYAIAYKRASDLYREFNLVTRKYLINSSIRKAHFIGQVDIETAMLRTTSEIGEGRKNKKGKWPAPAMEFYNVFFGRGLMQLTWPSNYEGYLKFRTRSALPDNAAGVYHDLRITKTSTHYWSNPKEHAQQPKIWYPRYDPFIIQNRPFEACDSAGWYWVSKAIGKIGTANESHQDKKSNKHPVNLNISRAVDSGVTPETIGNASKLVNGGGYGYFERQSYVPFAYDVLSDAVRSLEVEKKVITRGSIFQEIVIDYTPQR